MPTTDTRPHAAAWPAHLPHTLVVPETTLWFNLAVTAQRYPHKPAYVFFGQTLSYSQLQAQAEHVAAWLQGQGVQRGDRVLLFMQNCPQFVVAFYAVQRAGAVVVPVNPMNRAEEFAHYISDAQARVAITTADLAATVQEAQARVVAAGGPGLFNTLVTRFADALPAHMPAEEAPAQAMLQWLLAAPPVPEQCTRWHDALAFEGSLAPLASAADVADVANEMALLPYTSGTTGMPKGCVHTHRTLMANVVGGGLWGGVSAETVSLGVVPMFHITGMLYSVLAPVYWGSTVVLMPRWDRSWRAV
jgi:fatty-acyl-CoA synthase